MNYLVANWKSHKRLSEVKTWFEAMSTNDLSLKNVEVVICPSWPYIFDSADMIQEKKLGYKLGAQDISPFPFGAYTGAVAAPMVAEWVNYAIVGHSERRRYFHETDQDVVNKVYECLDSGIRPIVCVDEPYLESQLKAIKKSERKNILVAYEPLEAIGSGKADSPEHAAKVAEEIKDLCDNRTPVLYGGSVDHENLGYYLLKTDINGVLVGGSSLDADEWAEMIKVVSG